MINVAMPYLVEIYKLSYLSKMEHKTTTIFDMIIWGGAVISMIGLVGIILCIIRVFLAKRSNLTDNEMKVVLQTVLPLNLSALFGSFLGLIIVGVGIAFS